MSTTTRILGHGRLRKPIAVAAVVAALATGGCVSVQSSEGGFLMGGRIHVEEGDVARQEIFMMGGRVIIDGEARRDVIVLGGDLTVNGTTADVVNIGGRMRIGPDARIRGDLVNVGGSMNRSPGADIEGEVVNVGIAGFDNIPGFGGMPWSWGSWWGISPFRVMARTTQLVYWLLLAVLTVALAGDRVSSASASIAREPIRLGAIGLLGFLALLLLSGLFFVLSFLLIGIPFLLALIIGWWLAYVFGMVSVFQVLGQRVVRTLGKSDASQIGLVLTGTLILSVLHYFPWLGGLLWTVAAFVGLGAVFATRFGTNRPWFGGSAAMAPPAPPPPPPAE